MPLVCRIKLSKTDGVTLEVENAEGKITQTILMDGTSIITTVKGEEDTSKITQIAGQIKIEAKAFVLEAETITCKSTKASSLKSEDTFTLESTKDMTITSQAKLKAEATQDISLKSTSAKVDVEATQDATLKGLNVVVQGTAGATLKGAQTKVEGSATTDVKGPAVKVVADAKLDLEGALLELKGQMSTVGGSIIKIG